MMSSFKIKEFKNGMTIRELKELVKDLPERDEERDEDYEVWMSGSGRGLSSPVLSVCPLNAGDILFEYFV